MSNCSSNLYKDNNLVIKEEMFKLKEAFKDKINKSKNEFGVTVKVLDNLSPLKTLARGYSVVRTSDKTVSSVKDINVDDVVQVKVSDGKFYASVTKKEEN